MKFYKISQLSSNLESGHRNKFTELLDVRLEYKTSKVKRWSYKFLIFLNLNESFQRVVINGCEKDQ